MANVWETNDVKFLRAVVNADMEYFRALHLEDKVELDKLNMYISFKVNKRSICLCHIGFERFEGSPAEMLEKFEDIIEIGLCEHCEGRPKCPVNDNEVRAMQEAIMEELDIEMMHLKNDHTRGLAGLKPLHIAALLNHIELASWLLDHGVPIDSPGLRYLDPPINLAVIGNHKDMVSLLMTRGTDPNIKAEQTFFTPVYLAVERNSVEVLETLVEHGACCSDISVYGQKPLNTAVTNRRADIVKILIQGGALIPSQNSPPCVLHGESVLCYAIRNDTEIAKLLIEGGADVNEIVAEDNNSQGYPYAMPPVILATSDGKMDLLRLLLEKGAKTNVSIDNHSALHVAGFVNSVEALNLLLDFGADINALNKSKYSTLHHTAWEGCLEICQILLDKGADYDTTTADKNTPLSLACHGDKLDVIKLFLSTRTCNVNNKDKDNDTPLHYTAFNGNCEATQLLLAQGADPAAENAAGATPLWNATYAGNKQLIQLLLEYNVPVNVCSRGIDQQAQSSDVTYIYDTPKSPLYLACDKNLRGVPTLLWLAGLDLSQERWLFSGDLPQSLQMNHDGGDDYLTGHPMISELNKITHSTLSLKESTRVVIRKLLGMKLIEVAYQLEIPQILSNYLNFKA